MRSPKHLSTRRDVLAWSVAAPLMSGVPALAATLPPEDALRHALSHAKMPLPNTTLTLRQFETRRDGRVWQMTAVVEMTWPPGRRSRKFSVTRPQDEEALDALFQEIVTTFRKAADLVVNITPIKRS